MLDWAMSHADAPYAARCLLIGDLFETGLVFKRAQIRRQAPEISDEEVERRLIEWLRHPEGAEDGDADGRVVPWPRLPAS